MKFSTKQDLNDFLQHADTARGIPAACKKVVDIVSGENPALFDVICELIENAQTSCRKYQSGFVSTMWSPKKQFSQITYEASKVPRSYAFVCILRQNLPD